MNIQVFDDIFPPSLICVCPFFYLFFSCALKIILNNVHDQNWKCEIVMAVTVKIAVNWDVMECSLVERYYCLGDVPLKFWCLMSQTT